MKLDGMRWDETGWDETTRGGVLWTRMGWGGRECCGALSGWGGVWVVWCGIMRVFTILPSGER